MSNCVTTPTHSGGQPSTPAHYHRRREVLKSKVQRPPTLLRDEGVITQRLTATLRPSRLLVVDATNSVAEVGGCSEAYACVVGRRSRRRGWLSSAEAQTLRGPAPPKGPCHSRARSCGEPQRTAGTRPGYGQGSDTSPPQVSPATAAQEPKLPKLRAWTRLHSRNHPASQRLGKGCPAADV